MMAERCCAATGFIATIAAVWLDAPAGMPWLVLLVIVPLGAAMVGILAAGLAATMRDMLRARG